MQNQTSITALMSAFCRAFHAENNPHPVFADTAARQLLTPEEYANLSAYVLGGIDFFTPEKKGAFKSDAEALLYLIDTQLAPTPLCRAAFAENALKAAAKTGTKQYVILGAGLDSFSLRESGFMQTHEVFEVDHPATQADKINRLQRAFSKNGDTCPRTLRFVPVDFATDDLAEALIKNGFDASKKTLFSWLGVTYYLTKEAVEKTLNTLSKLCTHGSSLVFDAADENYFSATEKRVQNTIALAKAGGEEMKTAFSYAEIEKLLEKHGFLIYEFLTPNDIQRQIINARGANMQAFEHTNFVLAVKQ